jgi:putative ABC transport system ATP-binding protein
MSPPAVQAEHLMLIHRVQDQEIVALRGLDLEIAEGETVALLGPSGAGKSSLLALLAGLLRPSAGRVIVAGTTLGALSERELLAFRRTKVGVLLQNPARNLLPYATVTENLMFPQRGTGRGRRQRAERGRSLLAAVGLEAHARSSVRSLSGGEQQRLGLAVSVVNGPPVLLADEPTSQLDRVSSDRIAQLLAETRDEFGTTVVVVTHDHELAARFDRSVAIRDGRVGAEVHRGETFAVVGRDGSVQLPPEVLTDLPPGSLAVVTRRPWGVELRRASVDGSRPAGSGEVGSGTAGSGTAGPGQEET